MAKETAPATTPEIDVRWEMANYGEPDRREGGEGVLLTITKRHEAVSAALEEIAAQLVPDGVWGEELSEGDSLDNLIGETWETIERLFKAWAAREPERRNAIRAKWAAEQAAKAAAA